MEKNEVLKMCARQVTSDEADTLFQSKFWETPGWTNSELALLQLSQKTGLLPSSLFHDVLERSLGRAVYANEFDDMESLRIEVSEVLAQQSAKKSAYTTTHNTESERAKTIRRAESIPSPPPVTVTTEPEVMEAPIDQPQPKPTLPEPEGDTEELRPWTPASLDL